MKDNISKSEFICAVVHDLKEPLRTIASYAELMNMKWKDLSDEDRKEFCNTLHSSAVHLQELVSDLSLLKDQNKLEKESVNLNQLISDVKNSLDILIKENSAEITYDNLPEIEVSKGLVAEVFQNLFVNAVKYACEGVPAKIHVSVADKGNMYELCVADNGVGINPNWINDIFLPFKKVSTEKEGKGIGLAICQQNVELHGGRIWAISEPDKGSKLFFTLPKPQAHGVLT